jgi:hypothetical protein
MAKIVILQFTTIDADNDDRKIVLLEVAFLAENLATLS